jgi:hypothetical protein
VIQKPKTSLEHRKNVAEIFYLYNQMIAKCRGNQDQAKIIQRWCNLREEYSARALDVHRFEEQLKNGNPRVQSKSDYEEYCLWVIGFEVKALKELEPEVLFLEEQIRNFKNEPRERGFFS